jgi:hypothetical protein
MMERLAILFPNLGSNLVDLWQAGVKGHFEVMHMNPVAHTIRWLDGIEKGQGCEGTLGQESLAVSRGLSVLWTRPKEFTHWHS